MSVDQSSVLGHKPGLFILFFTEMWERFSFYGMRALFVIFLTAQLADGGWEWSNSDALKLYGWYLGLVYFTPIIGGFIADKFLGYRKAIILGAVIMTLGHASLAFETPMFFYIGLGLLIVGNGLFKPNISSMVGHLYKDEIDRKDSAYTIFYMGINAGSFVGVLLCGYLGEKIGWGYGFGLAGIFMFFGMLQFYFGQGIFGNIGLTPRIEADITEEEITKIEELPTNVSKDRITVIILFAFFTIFFWWAFEQAGGSMTVFANDYTNRVLEGGYSTLFKTVNTLITLVPMLVLSYVLYKLFGITFKKYSISNSFLGSSFLLIWGLVVWMLWREFNAPNAEVPASWFAILNAFFIITLAPSFSKFWEKTSFTGPIKFAIGLFLVGLGFACLSFGSRSIASGAETASVSMIWLVLAYLFHSMGELCVSPVGLSYISKLAPARLVGMMFGIWFLGNFVANLSAGLTGSFITEITEKYSISTFFLIFTIIPIIASLALVILNPMMVRKMHGIK